MAGPFEGRALQPFYGKPFYRVGRTSALRLQYEGQERFMAKTVVRPEDASIKAILRFEPSNSRYESARGKMLELVRRARRRLLNSELIAQGANSFSAAL